MQHIKAILGYTMAVMCLFIVLATFIGMNFWGETLVSATGLEISHWYSGGKIVNTIDHGDYKTEIHETVFQGLFSPRKQGFVQVDWVKVKSLPDKISEDIDFDGDKKLDFHIEFNLNENKADISANNPNVISLERTYKLKEGFAVRVLLNNPNK